MWAQLAMMAPSLLAALRSSGQQTDPAAMFQQLFSGQMGLFSGALEPVRAAGERAAIGSGNALAQDVSGALGRVGGASTGAGRVSRSLGNAAAGNMIAESEARIRQSAVEMARQNAMALLAPQLGFAESQRSGSENLLDWFARAASSGPLMELLGNVFQKNQSQGQGQSFSRPPGGPNATQRFGFNTQGRPPGFGIGSLGRR